MKQMGEYCELHKRKFRFKCSNCLCLFCSCCITNLKPCLKNNLLINNDLNNLEIENSRSIINHHSFIEINLLDKNKNTNMLFKSQQIASRSLKLDSKYFDLSNMLRQIVREYLILFKKNFLQEKEKLMYKINKNLRIHSDSFYKRRIFKIIHSNHSSLDILDMIKNLNASINELELYSQKKNNLDIYGNYFNSNPFNSFALNLENNQNKELSFSQQMLSLNLEILYKKSNFKYLTPKLFSLDDLDNNNYNEEIEDPPFSILKRNIDIKIKNRSITKIYNHVLKASSIIIFNHIHRQSNAKNKKYVFKKTIFKFQITLKRVHEIVFRKHFDLGNFQKVKNYKRKSKKSNKYCSLNSKFLFYLEIDSNTNPMCLHIKNLQNFQKFQIQLYSTLISGENDGFYWIDAEEHQKVIYVCGGLNSEARVSLNTCIGVALENLSHSKAIKIVEDMNVARTNTTLISVMDFLYTLGGYNQCHMNLCEKFHPEKNIWKSIQSMEVYDSDLTSIYYSKFLYTFGGNISSQYQRLFIEKEDSSWELLNTKNSSQRRYGFAIPHDSKEILLFGGGNTLYRNILSYNIKTNEIRDTECKFYKYMFNSSKPRIYNSKILITSFKQGRITIEIDKITLQIKTEIADY